MRDLKRNGSPGRGGGGLIAGTDGCVGGVGPWRMLRFQLSPEKDLLIGSSKEGFPGSNNTVHLKNKEPWQMTGGMCPYIWTFLHQYQYSSAGSHPCSSEFLLVLPLQLKNTFPWVWQQKQNKRLLFAKLPKRKSQHTADSVRRLSRPSARECLGREDQIWRPPLPTRFLHECECFTEGHRRPFACKVEKNTCTVSPFPNNSSRVAASAAPILF